MDNELRANRSFDGIKPDREEGFPSLASPKNHFLNMSYKSGNPKSPSWASDPITEQAEKYSNAAVLKEYKKMLNKSPYNPLW